MGLINAFSGILAARASPRVPVLFLCCHLALPVPLAERLSAESEAATQGTGAQGEAVGGCAALVATSGLPFHLTSPPSSLQLHHRVFAQATAKYSDDARWRTLACARMWLGHWDRRSSQRRCSALTGWQARSLCLLSSSTSALPPARSQHLHTPPSQQHVAHHLPLPLWCRCGHNTPPRDGPP